MQTSPFKNMRTNFLILKVDDGPPRSLPDITPWMHKHACAPHITPPRGACMALVPHCDTNQGRWRASLSCKHHSLLVLFKCLPSLFLLSLALSQPLPCLTLLPLHHPRLWLFSLRFSSPSKSSQREEGAWRPRAAEAGLSPGGQPVPQRMGLFPGPTKSISYSNVTIRPLTHRGLFMVAAPGRRVKMVI